jgi:hypothetical protein
MHDFALPGPTVTMYDTMLDALAVCSAVKTSDAKDTLDAANHWHESNSADTKANTFADMMGVSKKETFGWKNESEIQSVGSWGKSAGRSVKTTREPLQSAEGR